MQAGALRVGADEVVDLDRRLEPLDRHGAEGLRLHVPLGQPQRVGGDPDATRRGELFHPGGQMRGLADRGVVHVQVAADGAHDHLAGVQADAHSRLDAEVPARILGVAAHRRLQIERGVARAHGVILVGERRAEQRHDAVAHDLVHRALVAVYGVHHPLEHRIEKRAGLLRIAIGQQLHRALEVGEQHRHLLALARQRVSGAEDPLGQMPGRVVLGSGEASGWRAGWRQARGVSAFGTELGRRRERMPAPPARPREWRGALLAELGAGFVGLLAARALHSVGASYA